MLGNWSFATEGAASSILDLKTRPDFIRPETHWLQEVEGQTRSDGRLWFSLQLSRNRAQELCDAFAGSNPPEDFGELITGGALMAPASYAALRLAIEAANTAPAHAQGPARDPMDRMLGTDILVPLDACNALQRLDVPRVLEITDSGLALEGALDTRALDPWISPRSTVSDKQDMPRNPVIIAILDDGIGIANNRFRDAASMTRVEHFLDLSLIAPSAASGAVHELLGRSWTAADINRLFALHPDSDEGIYRALGMIDTKAARRQPLRMAISHGTHNLDTAAGYSWQTEKTALPDRPIIAVQLPPPAAEHRSDTWLPLSLKRALDWILVKADELSAKTGDGRRLPLVVNCSFGSMAGPQDGWSDVERRIGQFVRTYRAGGPAELCSVVMSAGNSRLLRAAARVPIEDKRVSLPWRVQPNDRTPSFAQIWLPAQPKDVPQQVRVALRPPGGGTPAKFADAPARFSLLNRAVDWTVGNDVRARLYHQGVSRPEDQQRECITIAIRPTDDDGAPAPVAPAGLWHIDIEPTDEFRGPLKADLHVHRDDVGLFARGKGRQSYFDDPNYRQVELVAGRPAADGPPPAPGSAMVTTKGTLNTYGYGEGTVLAGGYRLSDGRQAPYSGSGARHLHRREPLDGPDLAAVTDDSPALPGVLGAGTFSGSTVRLNGTSVAAPAVVRVLADEIAGGGSLNTLTAALAPLLPPRPLVMGGPPPPEPDDELRLGSGRLRF